MDAPPRSVTGMRRWVRLGWGLGLLATFPVAWAFEGAILADSVPICPLRIATGRPCALCGMTRAFACMTHGHWAEAMAYNPLWPAMEVLVAALGACLAIDGMARTDLAGPIGRHFARRGLWYIALLTAFTAIRWL